ncbi:hypothetical protein [Jiella mangrovi]|uniref:TIGR04255 family protein n=1 Tax=Jiella mangrovi TaxID=2821407 RepID=A0ABS4BCV7_9HYPH|nr:hypothetical protein [Jiella mangrovi]MBP0614362.1 hypothetical protein [Jiella mangrovi]
MPYLFNTRHKGHYAFLLVSFVTEKIRFRLPKAKISWAEAQLEFVSREVDAFIEENVNRVTTEVDPNHPGMLSVVSYESTIPNNLTVHIGRIVGCMKSALDNVAVEAALEVDPQANTRRIVFPFSGNQETNGCDKWFAGKVGPMKDVHRRIIVEARPYTGGNQALVALQELRNADEHLGIRLSITKRQFMVSFPSVSIRYSAPKPDGSIDIIPTYSDEKPDFKTDMRIEFSEPLFRGKEITSWLRDMLATTSEIVSKFDRS